MSHVERAVLDFKKGCNCSQAVFSAYAEQLGLSRADALKIALGFGGGMGRLANTCGAITGAFMVLGLKYGSAIVGDEEAKARNYSYIREFAQKFQERHSALLCKELLDYDVSKPEERELALEAGVFASMCPEFVRSAAEILEEMLYDESR